MPWQIVRVDRGEPLPEPEAVSFAISLGAEAAADDELEWIATELAWLRAADRADKPVLGVCFGAQILAVALGGGSLARAGLSGDGSTSPRPSPI